MPKSILEKLPDKAQDIYEAAWEQAKKDGRDDETAAKIAIAAVKRAGYAKDDETGQWSKMHVISMHITKATLGGDGIMRWAATVSKFEGDEQGDEITPEFYKYAIGEVESGKRPQPVLCVSHIDKGKPSDEWVAGDVPELFIDGELPKAKGTFRDTPLGKAAFEAIRADYGKPDEEKTRISLGFYDEGSLPRKTEKSDGTVQHGRRFLKGWIKHLALTRVPVVKETEISLMEGKAMAKTKQEDAASIVGDELAEKLARADKAELEDGMVLKGDQPPAEGETAPDVTKADEGPYKCECPECGHKMESDEHCRDVECPECGAAMRREERPGAGKEKAKTKTDDGKDYGPSAYLVVPDEDKPSEWKLRIEESPGEVTAAQLGRAAAALGPKGYRGQKVELSDDERKAAAKKLIGKYRAQDVDDGDIPDYLWGIAGMKKPKAEKSVSLDDFRERIYNAWDKLNPNRARDVEAQSWVREVMDDAVIVNEGGDYLRIPYAVDAETGEIAFGTPVKVQEIRQFVPVSDAGPLGISVPHVATKAITDERENQIKELLAQLAGLLGAEFTVDTEVANSAAAGNKGTNPPRAEPAEKGEADAEPVTETGDPSEPTEPPAQPAQEPSAPHSVEVATFVDDFANRIKAALLSDGDRRDKFAVIQREINTFGEGVVALVKGSTPPSGRDIADVVSDAVQAAVGPLHDQLAGVKAELDDLREKATTLGTGSAPPAPAPRSLDTKARVIAPNQQPTGPSTKARTAKELAYLSTQTGPGY